MGRPPVIDRNLVLDTAEAIVRERGVAGLTIGAVAAAAGISKGGVQSCIGTKEQLIHAIFERWDAQYAEEVAALAGERPTPLQRLRAHVEATRRTDDAEADRAAALMSALLDLESLRSHHSGWYRARFELADPGTPEGRRARLAFLACEGAFILHCFGFLTMTDEEWEGAFEDIEALMRGQAEKPG